LAKTHHQGLIDIQSFKCPVVDLAITIAQSQPRNTNQCF
jgi:hypothetical protein